MAPTRRLGIGADCSALTKYLHPAQLVNDRYPNRTARARISGLLCIRQEEKVVNHKKQICGVFRHPDFEGSEVYCVLRWVRIAREGGSEHFFGRVRDNPNVVETLEEGNGMPIEERVFQSGSTAEDISLVRDMGFDVDDDNSPDPANIPTAESNIEDRVPPE